MTECDQASLYNPRDERDSCGFGLIAQLDDHPSRATVDAALALINPRLRTATDAI